MSHWIVIFDLAGRNKPEVNRIEDAHEAAEKLFECESRLKGDTDRGVILLYAEDEASLRKTHGSFFLDLDQLLETAVS